jgi:hypothetical protein
MGWYSLAKVMKWGLQEALVTHVSPSHSQVPLKDFN